MSGSGAVNTTEGRNRGGDANGQVGSAGTNTDGTDG